MKGKSKEVFIIDGYNVLNDWPELKELLDNLEYARDKLVDILAEYGVYTEKQIIIVFDAHAVQGAVCQVQVIGGLEVVYTAEGETADSYIEKKVYQLVRQGERVYVVTSDWTEQMVVLGSGGYRVSARELRADVKKARKNLEQQVELTDLTTRRHELQNRLSREVLNKLNELRRGR